VAIAARLAIASVALPLALVWPASVFELTVLGGLIANYASWFNQYCRSFASHHLAVVLFEVVVMPACSDVNFAQ
jgi:hypothetical protein